MKKDTMADFSSAWNAAIKVTPNVSSAISVIGSFSIAFHILRRSKVDFKKKFTYHYLMLIISFTDIISSTAMAFSQAFIDTTEEMPVDGQQDMPFVKPKGACIAQAWAIQMSMSTILCLACLCTHFYVHIVLGKSAKKVKYIVAYTVVSLIIPLAVSILLLFLGKDDDYYGQAGIWCWITDEHDAARFFFFYIPLWFAMVYTTILMCFIVVSIKETATNAHTESTKRFVREMRLQGILYCASFLTTWTFGTVNRIAQVAGLNSPFLVWLHTLMVPLQGFFNALVYGRPFYLAWRRRIQCSHKSHLGCHRGGIWAYLVRGFNRSVKQVLGIKNVSYAEERAESGDIEVVTSAL